MARFTALLDACVLVPIVAANTLLRLAEAELFRLVWSEQILGEVQYAIERVHPELAGGKAEHRISQMRAAFPHACADQFDAIRLDVRLPDPHDLHVVEAAVRGRADVIVTNNLKDFPSDALDLLGLEAQSLDDFLLNQLDLEPDITMRVLGTQAAEAKNPSQELPILLEKICRAGAPSFAREALSQSWRLKGAPA